MTKTQKGLIGFFDILGYQSLLANNEPEIIVKSVLPLLTNLKTTLPDFLKDQIFEALNDFDSQDYSSEVIKNHLYKYIDEIEWLVFSDTILLNMPVESIANESFKMAVFFTASTYLLRAMFDAGLPLRGSIDFGKYYIESNCFAGQPIVNTYQVAESLELSACVLSVNLMNEIDNLLKNEPIETSKFKHHLLSYLVPTKNGEKYCYSLLYFPSITNGNDMRSTILSSFWKHKKSIPTSVQNKIENTEQWFHFVKFNLQQRKKSTEDT